MIRLPFRRRAGIGVVRKKIREPHQINISTNILALINSIVVLFVLLVFSEPTIENVITSIVFVGIITLLAVGYVRTITPQMHRRTEMIGLAMLACYIVLVFAEFARLSDSFPMVLIPVSFGAILVTILVGTRFGILFVMTTSLIISGIWSYNFRVFFIHLVMGLVAVYYTRKVHHRHNIMRAGLLVSVAGMLVTGMFDTFLNEIPTIILENMGVAFVNGLGSAILAIGLLPYFEALFHITTDIRLLELADLNQPLLRRLMLEAPGTYHHSLMVGNFAEQAAQIIGANPILARVGGYYHDIGKIEMPEYFSENTSGPDSKHQHLRAPLSARVVVAHIKDGVELARRSRLDKVIIDIIEQHHGTTLVSYFYDKAKKEEKNSTPSQEEYRYPGPKPKTLEAALIMLADACEANSHALKEISHDRIVKMVRRIIEERLQDGQLDECQITMKQLKQAQDSFVQSILALYHRRVEYPKSDEMTSAEASKRENRNHNSKPAKENPSTKKGSGNSGA